VTINSLLKVIPEDKRDYFVEILIPFCMDSDSEKYYPLIEVIIDDVNKRILLEADL
jgi:hypothetical protein